LYEAYLANVSGGVLQTICALHWDLTRRYPRTGRGEQCTTADAAGFPIAPLLFNADEVAAAIPGNGDIGHAIRFILPNARIAGASYVHPATHGTTPPNGANGPATTVPYGVRMRLKSTFDIGNYNPAAQVLLRTMKRYGIVLADGGNIALTGESDRYTTAKWDDLGFDTRVFVTGSPAPQVTDFEVVETGPRHDVTYDCVRTPDDFVWIDGIDY
jgi:serine/threonine-protein kinase